MYIGAYNIPHIVAEERKMRTNASLLLHIKERVRHLVALRAHVGLVPRRLRLAFACEGRKPRFFPLHRVLLTLKFPPRRLRGVTLSLEAPLPGGGWMLETHSDSFTRFDHKNVGFRWRQTKFVKSPVVSNYTDVGSRYTHGHTTSHARVSNAGQIAFANARP
jgi:hypothetical protein